MTKQTQLFVMLGLGAGVAYLLWTKYRQNNAPNDKDVEGAAQKTVQKANALETQATRTAEMAARNAYNKAQAQLAAAAAAQRYAAGGIAYPQFAPSYGTAELITGRATRGQQLGVI